MEQDIGVSRIVSAALAWPCRQLGFNGGSRRTIIAALLGGAAICGLAGCGHGKSGGDAPPTSTQAAAEATPATKEHDVCALVGKADMEAILGGTIAQVGPTDAGFAPDGCEYQGPSGSGRSAVVSVAWENGTSTMAGFSAGVNLVNNQMPPGSTAKTDDLKGLGDEAHFLLGGVLGVRKGDRFLAVMVAMQPDNQRKAEAIARKALPGI